MSVYTKVGDYTTTQLLNKVKGLSSFKGIPTGYWILGIRSQEDTYDVFDDKFYIFKGETLIDTLTGTTNPGSYGLMNFSLWNKKGVAVVKSDEWYYGVWTRGLHKGKSPALKQTGGFKIIRDGNKNKKSGDSGEPAWEYGIGINFHTNTHNYSSRVWNWIVGGWSTGCQVTNDVEKFVKFLDYTKGQNLFTYCLISEF